MVHELEDLKKCQSKKKIQKSHTLGPGPTHNSPNLLANHRMSKDNKIKTLEAELKLLKQLELENLRKMSRENQQRLEAEASFPAIFPYEGKAAIMAEIDQQREDDLKKKKETARKEENEVLKSVEDDIKHLEDDIQKLEDSEGHIDNTVESSQIHSLKTNKVFT